MKKVYAALKHVQVCFPEVTQVFYGADGRWLYFDADCNYLDLSTSAIDESILEEGAEEASHPSGHSIAELEMLPNTPTDEVCPHCGHDGLNFDSFDFDGADIMQVVGCQACERCWTDQYVFRKSTPEEN